MTALSHKLQKRRVFDSTMHKIHTLHEAATSIVRRTILAPFRLGNEDEKPQPLSIHQEVILREYFAASSEMQEMVRDLLRPIDEQIAEDEIPRLEFHICYMPVKENSPFVPANGQSIPLAA